MSTTVSARRLLGRRGECAALDQLVASVRAGPSRSLVLRGDAGVGKSALLEYLMQHASGCAIARAAGVESEMELAYAGLQQLCAPFLDRVERLPVPQRDALGTAFGLRGGDAPDRFLVGLAALSLLSAVAEERPLVCILDDAQWLDAASAQALAFVARRLGAESVGLVFAVRKPLGDRYFKGLPELVVPGLDDPDARELLAGVVSGPLDERVRDRIVAETRGNPLALLELPRGLTVTQLAGGFGMLSAQALSGRIEESFEWRLRSLPEDARLLLLVAAAEPVGDPLLLWRAVDRLGIGTAAAAGAEAAGLLSIGARVTFRHPLVRSAVYRSAPTETRRVAHTALAEATDPENDPDRRAWHRAAAAARPDEALAEELERSAGRAQARGGVAAAAAFLEQAVALSTVPERRTDRALAAADASLRAGAFDTALAMLAAAEASSLDDLRRARLDLLRAEAAFSQNRGNDAPPLLLRAAKTLEPLDLKLARETYLDAWSAAMFAGRLANAGNLHDVSREARRAPGAGESSRPSDLLLDGFSLVFTEGRSVATPVLQEAVAGFAGEAATAEEMLRWGWLATAAAVEVWDFDSCLAIASRGVQVARDSGALAFLTVAVNVLTQAVTLGGDFEQGAQLIAEARAARDATGTQVAPYGALVLAGFQGREAAFGLIEETIRDASAGGQGTAVQYARWARAMVLNGVGRYDEALEPAREASEDTPELFVSDWALSEVVEAAARTGDANVAQAALELLVEHTRASGTDWGLGVAARARAVLSEADTAERFYREAIERLGRTRLRPELARAHLLYGEWLRRAHRRVDAREQLRLAHTVLSDMGMEAFAERARRELQATGETVRKRTVETLDELTPQEVQVARLAAGGKTNPEIGAQLFLSPRTVEWHLRKVFGKLGISSRKELRSALSDVGAAVARL